ncbi:MAG: hypothetical protein HY233_11530 [Acidobacteriales bacterium]|nr:hypothetical protein [Terriglobales bacterium]
MTADTKHRGVEFLGLDRGWVIGVLGQGAVTGLAVDARMLAVLLLFPAKLTGRAAISLMASPR